jgi:hypothetical protein
VINGELEATMRTSNDAAVMTEVVLANESLLKDKLLSNFFWASITV